MRQISCPDLLLSSSALDSITYPYLQNDRHLDQMSPFTDT